MCLAGSDHERLFYYNRDRNACHTRTVFRSRALSICRCVCLSWKTSITSPEGHMATVHPDVQSAPPPGVETTVEVPELRIYSHSPLYYWWPVWVTGFILALITR